MNVTKSLLFGMLLFASQIAFADVPTTMNYQGRLTDAGGELVADGNYTVNFTIYDAGVGGTTYWTEQQLVSTTNGLFAVLLGTINPLAETVFEGSSRYLGIGVDPDPEMSPRTVLASVPYAFQAGSVSGMSGMTPHTDWLAPYFTSDGLSVESERATFLSIYNADSVTNRVELIICDSLGIVLGSCIKSLAPGQLWRWESAFQGSGCIIPATNDGYVKIQAEGPVAPWGYVAFEHHTPFLSASASLIFYKL